MKKKQYIRPSIVVYKINKARLLWCARGQALQECLGALGRCSGTALQKRYGN